MNKILSVIAVLGLIAVSNDTARAQTIVTEDPASLAATIAYRASVVANTLNTVSRTISLIESVNTTVQNQLRTIESLAEGDFDGVVRAFEHQANALDSMNESLDQFDYLRDDDFFNASDEKSWNQFRAQNKELAQTARQASQVMYQTKDLLDNSKSRLAESKRLNERARSTNSLTAQSQIFNQQLALLQGEISDVLKVNTAAANFAATLEDKRTAEERSFDKWHEDFWSEVYIEEPDRGSVLEDRYKNRDYSFND